jgi:hypothetical protein
MSTWNPNWSSTRTFRGPLGPMTVRSTRATRLKVTSVWRRRAAEIEAQRLDRNCGNDAGPPAGELTPR